MMEQNFTGSRRNLWRPALPYALDYLGLVLATAYLSMFWFMRRLGSLHLAVPLGASFTILASMVYYRWQHSRWLRHKAQLECTALRLWLTDELLSGTIEDFRELVCDLLTSQRGYHLVETGKHPLLAKDDHTYKLIVLRRHPSCPADAQLLMQLNRTNCKSRILAVSTSDFTDAARNYARKSCMQLLATADLAALAQTANMHPSSKQKEYYMRRACSEHRNTHKKRINQATMTRSLRYFSGAALLGLMGVLSPWRGWYWLVALYCAITGTAGWLSTKEKRAGQS